MLPNGSRVWQVQALFLWEFIAIEGEGSVNLTATENDRGWRLDRFHSNRERSRVKARSMELGERTVEGGGSVDGDGRENDRGWRLGRWRWERERSRGEARSMELGERTVKGGGSIDGASGCIASSVSLVMGRHG
jgi:hypothetical protein